VTEGNGKKAGNQLWEPRVNEQVLVRAQQTSDATVGVTAKFIHPYEGPYTGCPGRIVKKHRESVPYVKIYRYNPKHLCPKLNGY
jgi:hypothetical protein